MVLCDLEGLSYLEAAARLGWTEPTLRNRLAQARSRLKGRLARCGLAPTGSLWAWTIHSTRLAVSAGSIRTVTATAIGQSIPSTTVLTIATSLSRGLLMPQVIRTIAIILSAITFGFVAQGTTPPTAQLGIDPARPPAAQARSGLPVADPVITGQVVDPDGQPVAGASVRTNQNDNGNALPTVTTTGPDGRFTLPASPRFRQSPPLSRGRIVLAWAPGFGPGWTMDTDRPDITIRLVPPGKPVEGWIVTRDRQPVAGATVQVFKLYVPVDPTTDAEVGDMAGYLGAVGSQKLDEGVLDLAYSQDLTTDAEGRFRIEDLGGGRMAALNIRAADLASACIYAVTTTTTDDKVPQVNGRIDRRTDRAVFPYLSPFMFQSALSRPIAGLITDAATGQPLQGWRVEGRGSSANLGDQIATYSDAQGRYNLTGLPIASRNRLALKPPAGQPYLPAGFDKVPAPDGPGPVHLDHAASRGIVIQGRVTEKLTGIPVAGTITAEVLPNNPHIADYPGFATSSINNTRTDAEGRYQVIVPNGGSLIAFAAQNQDRYGLGRNLERTLDSLDRSVRDEIRHKHPLYLAHAITRIDATAASEPRPLDFQVEVERTVRLLIQDRQEIPIAGVEVAGWSHFDQEIPHREESSTVLLRGFTAGESRRVAVIDRDHHRVGSQIIHETDGSPQVLQLGPWGEIKGRVLNDDGTPRRFVEIVPGLPNPTQRVSNVRGILPYGLTWLDRSTDGAGHFQIVGLVPGLRYQAVAAENRVPIGDLFENAIVTPGEVKDLGDLKIRPWAGKP